jgi:hypothetical protein
VRYVSFFGNDFTPAMIAGTVQIALRAGETSQSFTIRVIPKTAAPAGATKTVKVTATHATVDKDAVKARVENGLPGE